MRKRKDPPLGPARAVRTIPIPINTTGTMHGRRPFVPLDPSLAELASGLLPPTNGGEQARWASWSVQDQHDEWFAGAWQTPVVDGEEAAGDGAGFPPHARDDRPVGLDEVTSAARAGWPIDPAPPTEPRSLMGSLADIGTAADNPSPGATPARSSALDAADFAARLGRGTAFASSESQLLTLAERALTRLSPDGASRWLVARDDGTLAVRLSTGEHHHVGCAVAQSATCPAITSGQIQHFDRSDELDACPNLLAAGGGACAAVCVPVSTPGPLHGVVHVTAPTGSPLDRTAIELVERTAQAITDRLAEIRPIES